MAYKASSGSLSALKDNPRLRFPETVSSPKLHESEDHATRSKNDVVPKLALSDSRAHPESPTGLSISAIAQKETSFRGTAQDSGERVSKNDAVRGSCDQELAISLLGLDEKGFLGSTAQLGLDRGGPARRSLEIRVVDETALIGGPVSVPKPAKITGEMAPKRPRKKAGEGAKRVRSEGAKSGAKAAYSRAEMEALRFENAGEQRRMWKDVHLGLGPAVRKEFDDLLASNQPKNIHLSFDHGRRGSVFVKNKDQSASIFGVFVAKGRLNTVNVSAN